MPTLYFKIFFFISICPAMIEAFSPVIFYSDLVSGPNRGGKDDKGAWVTICGSNFGDEQKTSYVSVGGGTADNYALWTDKKVIFQLGGKTNTGNIFVTTWEGASNGIPFTVREGRILFVDASSQNIPGQGNYSAPWRSPESFYNDMKPGDICYIRAGIYSGSYGKPGSRFNLEWDKSAPSGFPGKEIAWIAYPCETAEFDASGPDITGNFNWTYPKDCYMVAGFTLRSTESGAFRITGNDNRIINNNCTGSPEFTYSLINPAGCNGSKIYGNKLHGISNGNKLCHPLYIGYGSDNTDFGWNHIYDNDVAEGPLISVNQDNAHENNEIFLDINIHDNLLECTCRGVISRAIGVVEVGTGSTINVYNNIIIDSGGNTEWNYCMYRYSGAVKFYNNTIFNSKKSYAIYIQPDYPETVEVRNNIFYNSGDCAYMNIPEGINIIASNNCYYGAGNGPPQDSSAVNNDPLFVDAASGDFNPGPNSPCIKAGADTKDTVKKDFYGADRPATPDIGAVEHRAVTPSLYVRQNTLFFSDKPGNAETLSFTVTNKGGGLLTGLIHSDREWMEINPQFFTGNYMPVYVTVKKILTGGTLNCYSGAVTIDSNGGITTVPVFLSTDGVTVMPNPVSISQKQGSKIFLTFFGNGIYGNVKIKVYTLSGNPVKTLSCGSVAGNSNLRITWDGLDEQGMRIAAGIYVYEYETSNETGNGKFTVIR